VLAAASAPGTARELAGESKAVARFRTANLHPVSPIRRRAVLKTAAAKLVAEKVVVGAAVAVAATGGIAVAAAASLGSGPANHDTRPAVTASGTHPTGTPSAEPDRPNPLPTPTSMGRPSTAHPSSSASPAVQGSPNRRGQGRVFASSAGGDMCAAVIGEVVLGGRWDGTGWAGLTAVLVPRRAASCAGRLGAVTRPGGRADANDPHFSTLALRAG
jgi:hypothetical protein